MSRSFLLSHHEENDQKEGVRDLKQRNWAQNQNVHKKLSKKGLLKFFFTPINGGSGNQRWRSKSMAVVKVNRC